MRNLLLTIHILVVQLQSHLSEAMKHMKEASAANTENVDKRLITNLFVTFLGTPRGEKTRWDILNLIANILQFTEEEKYMVGLIRRPGFMGDGNSPTGLSRRLSDSIPPASPGGVVFSPKEETVKEVSCPLLIYSTESSY